MVSIVWRKCITKRLINVLTFRAGRACECDLHDYGSSKELEHQCRLPTSDTDPMGPICADHGECVCGQCDCNYGFSGKYCHCLPCPL